MKACLKNSRDRDYIPRLRIGVLSSFRWQCPPAYPNTLFLIDIQLGNPLTRFSSTVRRPSSGGYGGRLSLYGHRYVIIQPAVYIPSVSWRPRCK